MGTRQHRSFRFAPGVLDRLDQRAADEGLTRTALAERYVEEGLRRDDHPGIVFVDGPAGRRAALAGTGLDVWEVVEAVRHNRGSAEDAAAYLEIAVASVQVALRYYADFQGEIDGLIDANARYFEREDRISRRVADALA